MLNPRLTAILRELMRARSAITGEDLASIIQVTSRTVRNDMKELDSVLARKGGAIKSVRGIGYELVIQEDHLFKEFLQSHFQNENGASPATPEDRLRYLMKRLLLADGYLKIEDLADELYISKSTIQNDFRDVKKMLEGYGIAFEARPGYGMRLIGDEVKLRFCMAEFIFNRNDYRGYLAESGISILPRDKMQGIKEIILDQIKEYSVSLSDVALDNLVIHIAIAFRRIGNGNHVSLPPEELTDVIKTREYKVAEKIISKLETKLMCFFPKVEIAYITMHLLGTRMAAHLSADESELHNETTRLTIQILEEIEKELNSGILDDKELVIALSLHLKPAINRFKYGMNIRNPMLSEIKLNYPVAFEAGIIASRVLKRETGITINDDEIGYLALHIGAALERKEMNVVPKRCLVVCASGIGSARLLSYKLQSKFGARIEIVGTTEYYKLKEYPFQLIDFVVSTIPIRDSLPVPVIEVNTFLGEGDLQRVQFVLKDQSEQSFEYIKEELVFLQEKFNSRESTLQFFYKKLLNLGLVDESFLDSVLEREAISPTSFGNLVAIPHPISPLSDTTFLAMCTLQKPIDWGGNRAQFICLLSVEKNSTQDLQKMYDLLGTVVDDGAKVQLLLKSKTYKEFIKCLFE
ncbi:BglG family transcription antiterminator [Neobacillus sp. 3P2-tot-E-2]|uniref:BglG family transcription antiterminator n=1 Tax=Neobacillus sp. 3P2-tot-E-2 TaxID=3132212 RepID=UPI0039A2E686